MRIDLTLPEVWSKVCDHYRAVIPFSESPSLLNVYAGYQHALWEVTHGLARLFSHKKTIVVIGPTEPSIELLLKGFSEDEYIIKTVGIEEVQNTASWLDPVSAELVFVLFLKDDPVTGRVYETEVIDTVLKDKRIFRISLSHAAHDLASPQTKPSLFEVRVLSLHPHRALVIGGERCRIQPLLAPVLPWDQDDKTVADQMKKDIELNQRTLVNETTRTILALEKRLPLGFRSYFQNGEQRVWDRAVFYSAEFDGSAVIDLLALKLQTSIRQPGEQNHLESSSPCRWQSPRVAAWLQSRGESQEVIRGLVIIGAEILSQHSTEELLQLLSEVATELRQIQNG